jgi:hypothetical protein
MLVLNSQFLNISSDNVNPGAIYDVVRVPIARDAFMDEFAILLYHLLLQMHELVVLSLIFPQGRHEAFLFEFIHYREYLGLRYRPVDRPCQKVYPANERIMLTI